MLPNELYAPLLSRLAGLLDGRGRVTLAIDGCCGSGKSSLAAFLAGAFPGSSVFHTDDFYLPMGSRRRGWEYLPAGNMDISRLRLEVLVPAVHGCPLTYRPYSCQEKATLAPRGLRPGRLVILEGSYSLHPELRPFYDLSVFLSCSGSAQLARLRAREGQGFADFERLWMPMERRYYAAFSLPRDIDMKIDTSALF